MLKKLLPPPLHELSWDAYTFSLLMALLLSACSSSGSDQPLQPPAGWKLVLWDAGNRGDFTGIMYLFGPHAYYSFSIPNEDSFEKGNTMTDRILDSDGNELVALRYWGCPAFRSRAVADQQRTKLLRRPPLKKDSDISDSDILTTSSSEILESTFSYWTDPRRKVEEQVKAQKRLLERLRKLQDKGYSSKPALPPASKEIIEVPECSEIISQKIGDMLFWRADLKFKHGNNQCEMASDDGVTLHFPSTDVTEKIVASIRRK